MSESNKLIDDVRALLNKKLPTTTLELKACLRASSELRMGILDVRIAAQTELFKRRLQYLHPKDKDMTDFDRKTHLDSYTAEYQAEYELIAGLEKLLEQRVDIIRILLG